MSIVSIVAHLAESGPDHIAAVGNWAHHAALTGVAGLNDAAHPHVTLVADNAPSAAAVDDYRAKLAALPKETQLGWLAAAGT
jgi:PTS system glucitol/sorbitol-specific IIC component